MLCEVLDKMRRFSFEFTVHVHQDTALLSCTGHTAVFTDCQRLKLTGSELTFTGSELTSAESELTFAGSEGTFTGSELPF